MASALGANSLLNTGCASEEFCLKCWLQRFSAFSMHTAIHECVWAPYRCDWQRCVCASH